MYIITMIQPIIPLFILISCLITPVISFASWLECYVDLADSTEVIMNMRIQKYDDITYEPYKSVSIEYQYEGTSQWIVVDAASSEPQSALSITNKILYPPNVISTMNVRLHVPDDLLNRGIHQIQYVMDLVSINGCHKDSSYKEYGTCLTTKFSNPTMCDGKRSHSIDYKTYVTLQIDDTPTSRKNDDNNNRTKSFSDIVQNFYNTYIAPKKNNDIVIVAGWAAGREAVKITKPLILHRGTEKDFPTVIDKTNGKTNEL